MTFHSINRTIGIFLNFQLEDRTENCARNSSDLSETHPQTRAEAAAAVDDFSSRPKTPAPRDLSNLNPLTANWSPTDATKPLDFAASSAVQLAQSSPSAFAPFSSTPTPITMSSLYPSAYTAQGYVPFGADPTAFYSPIVSWKSNKYLFHVISSFCLILIVFIQNAAATPSDSWRPAPPAAGWPYDAALSSYPYTPGWVAVLIRPNRHIPLN